MSGGSLDADVADASIPLDIDAKQGRSLDAGSSRRLGVDRSHLIAPAGASRSDDRTSGGRIRGARRDGRSSRAIDAALLRLARGPGVGRWTGTGRAARCSAAVRLECVRRAHDDRALRWARRALGRRRGLRRRHLTGRRRLRLGRWRHGLVGYRHVKRARLDPWARSCTGSRGHPNRHRTRRWRDFRGLQVEPRDPSRWW